MERIDSLYLHVPFCTWVCKYCDFNAYAVLEGLIPPYVEALSHEIDSPAPSCPSVRWRRSSSVAARPAC